MNTTGNFFQLSLSDSFFNNVYLLDKAEFPKPWSLEGWKGLNWKHHLLFGWKAQEVLNGFALFCILEGDDAAHLLKICIASEFRGSGSAQGLWNFSLQELQARAAKSIYLEVETNNMSAIKFYQKIGFTTLRRIQGYYSDGGDALTMQLTI